MRRCATTILLVPTFCCAVLMYSSGTVSVMGFLLMGRSPAFKPPWSAAPRFPLPVFLGAAGGARHRRGGGGGNYGRSRDKRNPPKNTSQTRDTPATTELPPPPPLTTIYQRLRPIYFTCRHTYEGVLMDEIQRECGQKSAIKVTSPFPGLVRVESRDDSVSTTSSDGKQTLLPLDFDPVYALQSLPDCVVVTAESIKGMSREIHQALLGEEGSESATTDEQLRIRTELRSLPKGSLSVHALVPGMFKGQGKPIMQRRADNIARDLSATLKKSFPAARKHSPHLSDSTGTDDDTKRASKWLLQILLVNPTVSVASLTPCHPRLTKRMLWPNWYLPAGLADVEVVNHQSHNPTTSPATTEIPSSAFRKLLEAFNCMRRCPSANSVVVDLGASPGGWTAVLRLLNCKVVYAVDRAELAPHLMKDPLVEFVQGDAFAYQPEWVAQQQQQQQSATDRRETWMVSDIIAYPERIVDLLDRWCEGHWAKYMVVTMKFQGDIAWADLERAIATANRHGYTCRAKHFFNNKNEITLMVEEAEVVGDHDDTAAEDDFSLRSSDDRLVLQLGKPIYPVTLPLK